MSKKSEYINEDWNHLENYMNNCCYAGIVAQSNNLKRVEHCKTREELKALLETGTHITICWFCLHENLITISDTKYNLQYTNELKEMFLDYKFGGK